MFQCPPQHAAALAEVKRAVEVHHSYLDGWIYLFLANKKYDVGETVAKLVRRQEMERAVFVNYVMTDTLRKSMRAGIVQYIGRDKEGHPVLYFNTARDCPKAEQRPERQANMDMFLGWAARCDRHNPTATVTWLINQKDASMLRNTDLIFQKDMALRTSKFFPGVVGRMFICNMSGALTFVMKPLLRQLPQAISECIFLFSAGDIKRGELLKRIDAEVLPVEMGGRNDCDHYPNYERFATTVEGYFERCVTAIRAGISIKEMEMMEEFGVDKDGVRARGAGVGAADSARAAGTRRGGSTPRSPIATAASEETLDVATMCDPCAVTVDAEENRITVQSAVRRGRRGDRPGSPTHAAGDMDWNTSFASPPAAMHALLHRVPSADFFDCVSEPSGSTQDWADAVTTKAGLYRVQLTAIAEFSCAAVLRKVFTQSHAGSGGGGAAAAAAAAAAEEQRDACTRDWVSFRCQCVALAPQLQQLLAALRLGAVVPPDEEGEVITKLRRCGHFMFNLFPQTRQTIPFLLLDWFAAGATARHRNASGAGAAHAELDVLAVNPRRLAFRLDCTSPDNVLLSAQAGAVEFMENWDDLIEVEQRKGRVARRLLLTWPPQTDRATFEAHLRSRARQLWTQLTPRFRVYIEAKVGISIAEFIAHYGLLVAGGRIDESAEWYRQLFAAVLQYRERLRRNWLFYVFPPADHAESSTAAADAAEPPTMEELLQARGDPDTDVEAAVALTALVEQSVRYTADQLSTDGAGGTVATRTIVERYLEVSKAKIYIPYDLQRTGVLPSESIEQHKRAAATSLREAQAPLQEFLFALVSLAALRHEYPAGMTEAEIKTQLHVAKSASAVAIRDRQDHRAVAISFARVCSELQGSFGTDAYNLLATYPAAAMPADGYALGLELLLAVAILRHRRRGSSGSSSGGGGGSGAQDGTASPLPRDLLPSGPGSSEDDASIADVGSAVREPPSPPTFSVDSLVETLNAVHHPASRLASLKRMYIY
ncbi:CRAL/TRIO domain containing protein [Novymonas esmeraldas]|uniref:CRAL/TRIO domain containing protein n=1 Tax=Novymonas esmeraldas TaxID=1808958 RepID=A0AAW0EP37_9TRYP